MRQSIQYKQTIESLKTETKKLREQLCLDTLQQSHLGVESELARLQEQGDAFAYKIELEKQKIADLENQITIMTEKLKAQRESVGGSQGAKELNEGVARKIKGLENKLDKSLQKYNESIAHNKQLREQIDKLRRERVVYDNIYKKLEEELQSKKEEMKMVIKKSNKAQKKRDEIKEKFQKLKEEAENEQAVFDNEWKELGNLIEKDKKMKEFLTNEELVPSETVDVKNLNKKVAKSAWNIAKEKSSIKMYLEKVEMYEEAFKKIEDATGISDIDELVRTFVDAEMQNYSLFNHVNDLSNEMEKLEQQINDIKFEIDKYKNQGSSNENQRKKQMRELEQRLEKTEEKAGEYEKKCDGNQLLLDSLKEGIETLFVRIGCTSEGETESKTPIGINDSNMLYYMGLIEEKTNEIIHMYTNSQQSANLYNIQFTNTSAPPPLLPIGKKMDIELPSVPDREQPDEDEASAPLSVKEMKFRSLKKYEEEKDKKKKKQ